MADHDSVPTVPDAAALPSDRDPQPEPPAPTMSMDARPSTTSFAIQTDSSDDE